MNLKVSKSFIICLFILLLPFQWVHATRVIYSFSTLKQEAQFNHLMKELRCLVCQNQDLADSNASLARDLRAQVYTMVRDGNSDHEIMQYLTSRYGDFILFKPPLKSTTSLLWLSPLIFLGIGLGIFWRKFRGS